MKMENMLSQNDQPLDWRPLSPDRAGVLLGGPPLSTPVDETDHVRGAPSALVTIVEYADFECLNCARVFPLLVRYLEEFGGTLRVAFRHFPLGWEHPGSALVTVSARTASTGSSPPSSASSRLAATR